MKKITISVTFKQWGHGYINIVGSKYEEWDPLNSGSEDYYLDPGSYTVTYNGVTGTDGVNGGNITVTENGNELAKDTFPGGAYSGYFKITV